VTRDLRAAEALERDAAGELDIVMACDAVAVEHLAPPVPLEPRQRQCTAANADDAGN
jgi:hypothetical protein